MQVCACHPAHVALAGCLLTCPLPRQECQRASPQGTMQHLQLPHGPALPAGCLPAASVTTLVIAATRGIGSDARGSDSFTLLMAAHALRKDKCWASGRTAAVEVCAGVAGASDTGGATGGGGAREAT